MKVAIIGAGVLGTSLGVLLKRAGYSIVAISSRNRRSAQTAASTIGMGEVVGDPAMAALGADLVLLAVPDRAIAGVAIQVAAGGALRRGAVVAHLSGGLPAGILSGVVAAGGWRGAMHPLQSFADVETALVTLPDTFFALEGDPEAVAVLQSLVVTLGGRPVAMGSGGKALYHAAASAASNFVVALMDYAVELMTRAGVDRDVALPSLLPLVRGTLRNLETLGLPDALTGPIARGDVGTVKRHLRALEDLPAPLSTLYRELARRTLGISEAKGQLDDEARAQFRRLLGADDDASPGTTRG